MGITKADLDAQRAMLARGEEKRKAARQADERERLRDTFAAAALTGLLASLDASCPQHTMVRMAYEWADAMLKEKAKTNHDAVPEAKDRTAGELGGARVTGNTPEPVGWVLRHSMYGPHHDSFYPTKATAEAAARMNPAWTLIPLYRSPALTDEEREAIGVALQCVESSRCQKHPEELAATVTLIRAEATLRKLLERLA